MLEVKIIFPIRHTKWVVNLVLIRKMDGNIRLCIDFQNLNRYFNKDNYLVPPMEQILQSMSRS
jgi:hypothetical protein